MSTHESESVNDLNFNRYIETKGLIEVTGSHVHSKSGNISETVQDRDVVTTEH